MVLTQRKGGEGGERELCNYCPPCFCSVWEGKESGIRNPESGIGMRNLQPFSFRYLWKTTSHLQYFLYLFFLIIKY